MKDFSHLKAGDKVLIETHTYGYNRDIGEYVVSGRTPKQIRVKTTNGEWRFYLNGDLVGGKWDGPHILERTPENEQEFIKWRLVRAIKSRAHRVETLIKNLNDHKASGLSQTELEYVAGHLKSAMEILGRTEKPGDTK